MPALLARTRSGLVYALTLLLLSACRSSNGLGAVPSNLVDAYANSPAAGSIALSLDREGNLRSLDAAIPKGELPSKVGRAVRRYFPRAEVMRVDRSYGREGEAYAVSVTEGGRVHNLRYTPRGRLIESAIELEYGDVPSLVLSGANRSLPGSLLRVLRLRRGETTEYRVEKLRHGATYHVLVAPDGSVLSTMRETPAAITIPIS